MRNLFIFLIRNNFFIMFFVLEVACTFLIIQHSNYHKASFINSSNRIAGKIQNSVNAITEYMRLGQANDAIVRENGFLRSRMKENFYSDSAQTFSSSDSLLKQEYFFMPAKVINNSINRRNNFLTLNKGALQGIRKDMVVISGSGIVGTVRSVSDHFATVMSFLHKDYKVSVKLQKSGGWGSLTWQGYDPAEGLLSDVPKNMLVKIGDTIVTTSSSFFPEDILVGTVSEVNIKPESNYLDIKIKLSTNFNTLSYVYVVKDIYKDERDQLEGGLPVDQ